VAKLKGDVAGINGGGPLEGKLAMRGNGIVVVCVPDTSLLYRLEIGRNEVAAADNWVAAAVDNEVVVVDT